MFEIDFKISGFYRKIVWPSTLPLRCTDRHWRRTRFRTNSYRRRVPRRRDSSVSWAGGGGSLSRHRSIRVNRRDYRGCHRCRRRPSISGSRLSHRATGDGYRDIQFSRRH